MTRASTKDNRRDARIAVAQGMWVAWMAGESRSGPRKVSRIRDLSAGGAFISTNASLAVGSAVQLLFALPEGEMRIHAIVRYADKEKGIGVEFTRMGTADRARLQELLRRLKR